MKVMLEREKIPESFVANWFPSPRSCTSDPWNFITCLKYSVFVQMLLSIKMTSSCLWPRFFTWTRGETATRWKCLHHLHSRLLGEENVSLIFEMNDCPSLKYPKILCPGLFAHRASLTHRRCPEASRSRTPRLVFKSFQLKGVKKTVSSKPFDLGLFYSAAA